MAIHIWKSNLRLILHTVSIISLFMIMLVCNHLAIKAQLTNEPVRLGIDNLIEMNFSPLSGKKVALLTNTSGRTYDLKTTASVFAESNECTIVSILAPEHGYFATIPAGLEVANDSLYGVPVYSLYGKFRRPTKSMLEACDIVVVDIQDIGIRSYTYISTLYNVMDACAEYGKDILVLDRPNPLGGMIVDGAIADQTLLSFVGIVPIPYIHGLTIGEFALLVNGEGMLPKDNKGIPRKPNLQILKMKNWKRSMVWEETGLHFVPTSPNIPSVHAVRGAAITGPIGELGSAGIGIGTTFPFQYLASPDINADTLLQLCNENLMQLGVHAGIGRYKIATGKYPNRECYGLILFMNGAPEDKPYSAGVELLLGLRTLLPQQFTPEYVKDEPKSMFRKIMSNDALVDALLKGKTDDEVRNELTKGRKEFMDIRKQYLLYSEY